MDRSHARVFRRRRRDESERQMAYEAATERYKKAIGRIKDLQPEESVANVSVTGALNAQNYALENVSGH